MNDLIIDDPTLKTLKLTKDLPIKMINGVPTIPKDAVIEGYLEFKNPALDNNPTPLNKAHLLDDNTGNELALTLETATVNNALKKFGNFNNLETTNKDTVINALNELNFKAINIGKNITIFTSGTDSFVVPRKGQYKVTIIGGGTSYYSGTYLVGSRSMGGAGGAIGIFNLSKGQIIPCTVGAAGSGITGGGTTSFGSYMSATGGTMGASNTSIAGGTATGGLINAQGGAGVHGTTGALSLCGDAPFGLGFGPKNNASATPAVTIGTGCGVPGKGGIIIVEWVE